jgi:hypothetical protein
MEVTFVDDQVSLTGWPAWAEAGEALKTTLGDSDGGANCAEMGFSPLAVSASTAKPNKTAVRSEWKRIVFTPVSMEQYLELEARYVPRIDARIAELHDGVNWS